MSIPHPALAVVVALLTGCASQSNWQPHIDLGNDRHRYTLQTDLQQCKELALQASNTGNLTERGKDAAIGGGTLAAGGCAIGSVFGSCGAGAAVGATVGGLGGLVFGSYEDEKRFKAAYKQCLWNRGHSVIQ
jgi:hypothetical protein